MKRMLALMLTAILMMTSASVLADTPRYSAVLQAEKLAIAAMYAQYGFTVETLGAFTMTTSQDEDVCRVSFQSEVLPYDRVGRYDAVVTGNKARLTWSLDGSDPAQLASGDPAALCWGAKQIETYLAVDICDRHAWVEPYLSEAAPVIVHSDTWDTLGLTRLPEDQEQPIPDDLLLAASAALKDVYALSDTQFDQLDFPERDMVTTADGRTCYWLTYPAFDLCFHVLIDAGTQEVLSIDLLSGGNG